MNILFIFALISTIELNIPTRDYIIEEGKIYMEGFGSINSLPIKVFPIIFPLSVDIMEIGIESLAEEVEGIEPVATRYAIQRETVSLVDGGIAFPEDAGRVLSPVRVGNEIVYPIVITPFFYKEGGGLVHTNFINIRLDCAVPGKDFVEDLTDGVFCIITTERVLPSLAEFISWKKDMGYDVSPLIIPPQLDASEIHNILGNRYKENPFSYLLIVGDYKTIPGFPYRGAYTDFYYGKPTQKPEDKFLPFREVSVGRIPCSNPEKVKRLLKSSMLYQIEDKLDILFFCSYDMFSPEIVKKVDSILGDFRVDYEMVKETDYDIFIDHTLGEGGEFDRGIVIKTTAFSGDSLLANCKEDVVGIIAPTSASYFVPGEEGGTSVFLYYILRGFLKEDMPLGEALRRGAIDYWTQYPDSFTEENIMGFHLFGDPTIELQPIRIDVGVEKLSIPFQTKPGEVVHPSLLLKNHGNKTAFYGKVTLELEEKGRVIYRETVDIGEISPKEERWVDFQGFDPGVGSFLVRGVSLFPVDINPQNDVLERKIRCGGSVLIVVSSDTSYGRWFIETLALDAMLVLSLPDGDLSNAFLLDPFPMRGENIYIEGFIPDRDYNGQIEGVGRFSGVSFLYDGGIASTIPEWLEDFSVAMVDEEENPVAFYSGSQFVFMGRLGDVDDPSGFPGIKMPKVNGDNDTLLFECNPNPSRGKTAILFEVSVDNACVVLSVYNIAGHLSRILIDGELSRGIYSYIFDGLDEDYRELVNGTYFLSLSVDGKVTSRKLIIIK